MKNERNTLLTSLPASLGQLGSLKQLTLVGLGALKVLTEAVVRLTSLGSLTIDKCGKLRALPRGIIRKRCCMLTCVFLHVDM